MRTVFYVVAAMAISLAIGYPVAYYAARHAGKRRGLILVLLVLPFWISYIMRMFAWTNLLATDGYAARGMHALSIDSLFNSLGLLDGTDWLGRAEHHRDPRARLRLRAVLHPAALRLARPARPAADRGRA